MDNSPSFRQFKFLAIRDVSEDGPQKGAPALVGAGMMGDRADVIFANPEEISDFISRNADEDSRFDFNGRCHACH
jgi:hypothetical protein